MMQRDGVWQKAMSGGLLHRSKQKRASAHLMRTFHLYVHDVGPGVLRSEHTLA
jgi:hypothetical protein